MENAENADLYIDISIHLPARGGICINRCRKHSQWFQYTSPHGEEFKSKLNFICCCNFNTPPRTGRNLDALIAPAAYTDFNTPPRTGRNQFGMYHWHWGRYFNTPPRTGRNVQTLVFCHILFEISIHLPARGGILSQDMLFSSSKFQYTSPHGEESCAWGYPLGSGTFQYTSPHGEE